MAKWDVFDPPALSTTFWEDQLRLTIVYDKDGGEALLLYDEYLRPILDGHALYETGRVFLTNKVRQPNGNLQGLVLFDQKVVMEGRPSETNELVLAYRRLSDGAKEEIAVSSKSSLHKWSYTFGTLVVGSPDLPLATLVTPNRQ